MLKKDEQGHDLPEIDWSQTRAIIWRMGEVWLNLRGRDPQGIVDPADAYELEEQIMTDLYGLKDEHTGHRLVYLAVRNKDAVVFGMGGANAGDIIFYSAEKFVSDHGDSLSTIDGVCGTSVRSIFLAAGPGIRSGVLTERTIHHVDVCLLYTS